MDFVQVGLVKLGCRNHFFIDGFLFEKKGKRQGAMEWACLDSPVCSAHFLTTWDLTFFDLTLTHNHEAHAISEKMVQSWRTIERTYSGIYEVNLCSNHDSCQIYPAEIWLTAV
ncbi:uncharacterized protein LOC106652116 [Trichogramma pretiosum]|uniref:uncharacterized protein LOC106652116 n=1 Tax=Trichogramma pretiosum TaxID=7493 RepID=UPI0006C9DF85|nr:uncharacterized protein LOC106652116 [Trichogramma pretiosum]